MINFQKKRKEKTEINKEFHRINFLQLQISRKEYYLLYPETSKITLKRYLRGL